MRSRVGKSRRNMEHGVRLSKRVVEEHFEVLEIVSLRDAPLKERCKRSRKAIILNQI